MTAMEVAAAGAEQLVANRPAKFPLDDEELGSKAAGRPGSLLGKHKDVWGCEEKPERTSSGDSQTSNGSRLSSATTVLDDSLDRSSSSFSVASRSSSNLDGFFPNFQNWEKFENWSRPSSTMGEESEVGAEDSTDQHPAATRRTTSCPEDLCKLGVISEFSSHEGGANAEDMDSPAHARPEALDLVAIDEGSPRTNTPVGKGGEGGALLLREPGEALAELMETITSPERKGSVPLTTRLAKARHNRMVGRYLHEEIGGEELCEAEIDFDSICCNPQGLISDEDFMSESDDDC